MLLLNQIVPSLLFAYFGWLLGEAQCVGAGLNHEELECIHPAEQKIWASVLANFYVKMT